MRVKNDIKIRKEREKKKFRLNSLVSKHEDWIYNKDKKSTTKQTIKGI